MTHGMSTLSRRARSLWAKTNRHDTSSWLPLYVHLGDAMAVVAHLWDAWVPQGTRDVVIRDVGDPMLARRLVMLLAGVHDIGKATPVFQSTPIASSPAAPSMDRIPRKAGLPFPDAAVDRTPLHPAAGQRIMDAYLEDVFDWDRATADSYTCVIGSHHGVPPTSLALDVRGKTARMGWSPDLRAAWTGVQHELAAMAVARSGLTPADMAALRSHRLGVYAATVCTGLVVMADWIASDTDLFPLVPVACMDVDDAILHARREQGWSALDLCGPWRPAEPPASLDDLFTSRFDWPASVKPRPVQTLAATMARDTPEPGLMVIEAPMGEGKTEAALAAAELLARRTGRGGVALALPTVATTDAMFNRVRAWVDRVPQETGPGGKSLSLRHGRAGANKAFALMEHAATLSSIHDPDDGAVVEPWFTGGKKGVLADFLVCTIDQVLMASLQMRHVALRQLALVDKVVVIDECHAYDAYMQVYLERTLEWLGGFRTPVILLSATLPADLRARLVDAYRTGRRSTMAAPAPPVASTYSFAALKRTHGALTAPVPAPPLPSWHAPDCRYPLVTCTSGLQVRTRPCSPSDRIRHVDCRLMEDSDEALRALLADRLAGGGVAGIICDTVDRAVHAADLACSLFGSDQVRLAHARFTDTDRAVLEAEVTAMLGPRAASDHPHRLVLVGTQVLEQSLDIDLDLLVSDLAPVDLLLQRMGRLHRHDLPVAARPVTVRRPACFLRGVAMGDVPRFARGLDRVYAGASLMEALAVLGLGRMEDSHRVTLPDDIDILIGRAYAPAVVTGLIHARWQPAYRTLVRRRDAMVRAGAARAHGYLLADPARLVAQGSTLVDLYDRSLGAADEDGMVRAVRNITDTLEVILLRRTPDGAALLPWVGGDATPAGSPLPHGTPEGGVARTVASCAVRLPHVLAGDDGFVALRQDLQSRSPGLCRAWDASPLLRRRLPLVMDATDDPQVFAIGLHGRTVVYSRSQGLMVQGAPNEGYPS